VNIAIIPARGGSKRIPRKNIKDFCGQPMIAWSIQAAIKSNCFEKIIVSTDDEEIAEVARTFGADVPFFRPPELSDDNAGTIPVIAHAIAWQNTNGQQVSNTCCIYATAPFIQVRDLSRGLSLLQSSGSDYVFSVTSFASPIQRAFRVKHDQHVEMFQPDQFNKRSQDLEEAWHDAGQFYWGKASAWLANKNAFGGNSCALPLPRYLVQDIDTMEDWVRAELLFQAFNKNKFLNDCVAKY
jgi:N-acylneuraminate cytidylyltransferase